jgi:hypothetical protein
VESGVGVFLKVSAGKLRAVTEEGRKIFFFPCFVRPGEEEDGAVSKRCRF